MARRTKLALTGLMLVYVGVVYLLPFTCPILFLTGIHCPGCADDTAAVVILMLTAKLSRMFAKVLTCLTSVGFAGVLVVEGGYHDYTCRTKFACCCDDVAHGRVELCLYALILGKDEAAKACTDSRNFDVSA